MKDIDSFVQGYACAISNIVKSHGSDVAAEEALIACGLTSVAKLKKHGVEEYDIKILTPTIKSIQGA
jgi:hypothetical protein